MFYDLFGISIGFCMLGNLLIVHLYHSFSRHWLDEKNAEKNLVFALPSISSLFKVLGFCPGDLKGKLYVVKNRLFPCLGIFAGKNDKFFLKKT